MPLLRRALDDASALAIKAMFQQAGYWSRLMDAGMLSGSAAHEIIGGKPAQELFEESLLAGLAKGDPRIMKMWDDTRRASEASQAFNVTFEITPYDIADASLARIVSEADEEPVKQILVALADRSEADGCPPELVAQIRSCTSRWLEWAREGLMSRRDTTDDQEMETAEPESVEVEPDPPVDAAEALEAMLNGD